MAAPARREAVLYADELGRAAKNSRGCRRLPPAVAARGGGAQAIARAQPVLQRSRKLDRIPPDPRRLRTGRAHPRAHELESLLADRTLDRGPHLVLGRAATTGEPARAPARRCGFHLRRADPD